MFLNDVFEYTEFDKKVLMCVRILSLRVRVLFSAEMIFYKRTKILIKLEIYLYFKLFTIYYDFKLSIK